MTSPVFSSDTAGLEEKKTVLAEAGPFQELGVTGLKRSAGYVDEEFLPQLRGKKSVQVYKEMSENDPIVGAMIFAITQLVRNADWNVIPGSKGGEGAQAAKLLETCRDDMSHSWDEFISEALSMIVYGWSWHEIVYKRRMGPWQKDGRHRSKYADGLIGWRKMPIRSQETLQRWVFDETGGVQAMVQMGAPDYQTRILPIERSLLFRAGANKGSPEGRSMLRNAYRPWYYKKRLEEFESIGVERDLAGLPVVKVPAAWLKARPGTEQHKQVEAFKKMIRGIRRNEQEGVVFPQQFDDETRQPMFELSLLGSGGSRQFQTDPLIQRYENRILMTCLADFIMVGHQRVGTYNLHLDKTGIFRTALNSLLQQVADTINRHAVPRLFAVNGWKPAELPYFQVEDVDAPDISQLVQFMSGTSQLGFTWGPDPTMENYLRRAAGLPKMEEGDKKQAKKEQRLAEATRFATMQTEHLAARSQLAQMMATEQMQAAGQPTPEDAQVMQQQQAMEQQGAMQQEDRQMQQAQAQEQLLASRAQRTAPPGGAR